MARPLNELAIPSTEQLDPRLVALTIEVNGRTKVYQNVFIAAAGVKYGNPLQDEAEITIYNLDPGTQDYILTETSPYNANATPKTVILEAGRQSYGTTVIYRGNIVYSSVSQPPDVGVTLKCLTGNILKSQILSRYQPGIASLEQITRAFIQDTDLILNFQATNKQIANYSFTGSSLGQVQALAALGLIDVYIDGDTLVVKDAGVPLRATVRDLSASTGMIGIPEFTERGVRVKFFIDNKTVIGGAINLHSEVYPAANGIYVIYQLAFQITNRLTPFYYIADCARLRQPSEVATNG